MEKNTPNSVFIIQIILLSKQLVYGVLEDHSGYDTAISNFNSHNHLDDKLCDCNSQGPWRPLFKPSQLLESESPEHSLTHEISNSLDDGSPHRIISSHLLQTTDRQGKKQNHMIHLHLIPHIYVPIVHPMYSVSESGDFSGSTTESNSEGKHESNILYVNNQDNHVSNLPQLPPFPNIFRTHDQSSPEGQEPHQNGYHTNHNHETPHTNMYINKHHYQLNDFPTTHKTLADHFGNHVVNDVPTEQEHEHEHVHDHDGGNGNGNIASGEEDHYKTQVIYPETIVHQDEPYYTVDTGDSNHLLRDQVNPHLTGSNLHNAHRDMSHNEHEHSGFFHNPLPEGHHQYQVHEETSSREHGFDGFTSNTNIKPQHIIIPMKSNKESDNYNNENLYPRINKYPKKLSDNPSNMRRLRMMRPPPIAQTDTWLTFATRINDGPIGPSSNSKFYSKPNTINVLSNEGRYHGLKTAESTKKSIKVIRPQAQIKTRILSNPINIRKRIDRMQKLVRQ